MTKYIQLQDLNTGEDLSPVVSIEGLRDKDGQKVDLSKLGGGDANVEITNTEDAELVLTDSTGAKFAEITNGVIRTPKFDMTLGQLAYANRFANAYGLVVGSFESSLRTHMTWQSLHANDTRLSTESKTYFATKDCNAYSSALPQDMWWYKTAKALGMNVEYVNVLAYGSALAGRINRYADRTKFLTPHDAYDKDYIKLAMQRLTGKYAFGVFVMNRHMLPSIFKDLLSTGANLTADNIKLINNWYTGLSIMLGTMEQSCSSTPIIVLLHDVYTAENDALDNAMTAIMTKLSQSLEIPTYVQQDGTPTVRYVQRCEPFKIVHVQSELSPKNNIDKAITSAILSNC